MIKEKLIIWYKLLNEHYFFFTVKIVGVMYFQHNGHQQKSFSPIMNSTSLTNLLHPDGSNEKVSLLVLVEKFDY